MTWLDDLPDGATDWERITRLMPEPFGGLSHLHRTVWETSDPALLELCRLRMAELLGYEAALRFRNQKALSAGLTNEKASAVRHWPTSPLFTAQERAWLALTEQWLGDVNDIPDELMAGVLEHNTPEECAALIYSLWPIEAALRTAAFLDLDESPEHYWTAVS
jgi:hypothetical protein